MINFLCSSISVGDWLSVIVAVVLFLITLRDIIVANVNKDFSRSDNFLFRVLLSRKEEITAKIIASKMGFDTFEDLKKNITKDRHKVNEKSLLKLLSECIVTGNNEQFKFGSHRSAYYIDTMGYAMKKDNCDTMTNHLWALIQNAGEDDFDYIFTTKGGNIPLVSSFDNFKNITKIIVKDTKEGSCPGDILMDATVKYEGFTILKDNTKKKKKGIAIACNLANGGSLLNEVNYFNIKLVELKSMGAIDDSIQPIEYVFILYRALEGEKLDEKCERYNLKCYRYFDLSEDDKQKICTHSIEDTRCYKCINSRAKAMCNAKYCYKHIK